MSSEEKLVTEVPSSLKQLARLVVRGFYAIEDALIVDMLIRNPCMKEADICDLLRFDVRTFRAKIATLRNDKFIQVRLKMHTDLEGKTHKVNYYYINYKTFVNVVKYKLHMMSKRLETEERDSTSRASFKCTGCYKTFTDLEADQLFDPTTLEFRCTFCSSFVEEDQSALPKKETRMLLAKLNDQVEPLYALLRQVEGIKLAPEILEPEPVDINVIRGIETRKPNNLRGSNDQWSGEATRGGGFAAEEAQFAVTIDDNTTDNSANQRKERPIWMIESTVINDNDADINQDSILDKAASAAAAAHTSNANTNKQGEDIMSVLLAHEKKSGNDNAASAALKAVLPHESSDSSDNEDNVEMQAVETGQFYSCFFIFLIFFIYFFIFLYCNK